MWFFNISKIPWKCWNFSNVQKEIIADIFRKDFKRAYKRIFAIFYRIEFSARRKGDFSPVDDGRDAFLFRGKLLSRKPMQLHFPWCYCPSERGLLLLFPLAKPVIAWKRESSTRRWVTEDACAEDCSRDLNGRIFLADFRTRYFPRTGSRAVEVRAETKIRLFALPRYRFMLTLRLRREL